MPIATSNTQVSASTPTPAGSDRRDQWSEARASAVVEAAYILQAVRR